MRVVALFRVSTEKQANDGASLDAQERIFRAHAARNGWSVVAEFRGCESATQAASDRRVLQQVLQAVREHEPDALYVHEQSRLTRGDELEVALLMRELKERQLKIIINGAVRDMDSIDDRFMVGIQSLVDRAESERIKERLMRGKKQRALQGRKASGAAPYGYHNPRPGDPGHGRLVIVEDEALVVRRLFEMCAAGMGDRGIAVALNNLGVPAPRGGRWTKSSVNKIRICLAYVGTSASNVWVRASKGSRSFVFRPNNPRAILVPDAHPAIVSRELWEAATKRPRRVRSLAPRMLSGLLRIGGVPTESDTSRGRKYYTGPRGAESRPWLEAGATDEAVWRAFVRLATEPEFVERLIREAADPTEQEKLAQEIQFIEGKIGKLRARLNGMIDLVADGTITRAAYKARSESIESEVAGLEKELGERRAKAVAFDGTLPRRIVAAIRALMGDHTKLDDEQRRRVLRGVVARIDVEPVERDVRLPRGPGGKIAGSGGRRWEVGGVRFELRLQALGAGQAPLVNLHAGSPRPRIESTDRPRRAPATGGLGV